MPNLRMRPIDSPVKLPIQNDSAADPGSDGHINQSSAVPSRAPSRLGQSGRVAVILHCHAYRKILFQITHQVLPSPSWKKIYVPEFAANWIDRTCRPNTDARSGFPE